ncbi:MAG: efflux RND transporter periplasmic adaptor subunit [Candidatus Amulumruptor caecigallinarius]|nr:efflux RND transporter periplasmic adaptor subunit [Candidatus Amulumruptor caecigallinarius]
MENKDIQERDMQLAAADDSYEVSKREKSLILAVVLVLVVLIALAIVGFLCIKQGPYTVQGQGEATEIRISGKLPGRVEQIFVEEGQRVHAGDTLVHIISNLADAQYDQALAMEEVARAADRKVDAGTRPQLVGAAESVWQQAQAATGIAKKTYDRMEALFRKGVVSAQKRDEAKAAYEVARSGEAAAKNNYELARSGAQREDKQAAAAMVSAAKSGVKKVNALLEDQYLLAPCDGEIVVVYPNASELVATGAPIMTLQKDDNWAVFDVRETYLKDIKLGKKIRVKIPALDKDTVMKVFYIKDLGTYANWQATKATGDYDARTFQIKARPEKPIAGFRPGMSVIYEGVEN